MLFGRGASSRWAALFAMSALRWRASLCEDASRTEAVDLSTVRCVISFFLEYVERNFIIPYYFF